MRYAWIAALGLIPVCCVSAKICIQQFIELASNFLRPLKIADSIAVVAALAVSIGSLSGFMRPASLFCRRSLGQTWSFGAHTCKTSPYSPLGGLPTFKYRKH